MHDLESIILKCSVACCTNEHQNLTAVEWQVKHLKMSFTDMVIQKTVCLAVNFMYHHPNLNDAAIEIMYFSGSNLSNISRVLQGSRHVRIHPYTEALRQ